MFSMPPPAINILILLMEMLFYFWAMLALFRLRDSLGIGAFFCALGSLHFVETYLAASYYVALPFDWSLSPGSVVLFSGKLALLLLVYIREDAVVARQPIYGLLLGNLILMGLVALLRTHTLVAAPGTPGDLAFMDQLGVLMLWSTLLLFIDCIMMILLYERASRALPRRPVIVIWLTLATVLSFDQLGFFTMLHFGYGVPFSAGGGGWVGKLVASGVYAVMLTIYLSRFETAADPAPRKLSDVFDTLTYRQRYEELTAQARRDPLTHVLHRGQFDLLGRDLVAVARTTSRPLSLLLVDIDNFKTVNDDFGHPVGDIVLRAVADAMCEALRQSDYVLRYGGDEFAVFAPGVSQRAALRLAAVLRERIATLALPPGVPDLTLSIGIATAPEEAESLTDLLLVADKRLYQAKKAGRDRVVGASFA